MAKFRKASKTTFFILVPHYVDFNATMANRASIVNSKQFRDAIVAVHLGKSNFILCHTCMTCHSVTMRRPLMIWRQSTKFVWIMARRNCLRRMSENNFIAGHRSMPKPTLVMPLLFMRNVICSFLILRPKLADIYEEYGSRL